jgi:hypothetical protein
LFCGSQDSAAVPAKPSSAPVKPRQYREDRNSEQGQIGSRLWIVMKFVFQIGTPPRANQHGN